MVISRAHPIILCWVSCGYTFKFFFSRRNRLFPCFYFTNLVLFYLALSEIPYRDNWYNRNAKFPKWTCDKTRVLYVVRLANQSVAHGLKSRRKIKQELQKIIFIFYINNIIDHTFIWYTSFLAFKPNNIGFVIFVVFTKITRIRSCIDQLKCRG